ncbi:sulfotransferase [Shewanella phaeophyticola]|uniref:Sulfotransferase n=1 Tax=Shewanella phaeophyticola TaxID=2978345 RepID=A0ABT2P2Z2_9GAMM|nr:sulfotransferase [Shewanella sp. KJ10-1]MCT8985735.1 sulfotransferase [Shewanella sp. KJ10-1]
MPSNFELFKKQLDEAVELIDESVLMDDTNYPAILDEALDTQSLLERCDSICLKHKPKKPVIRVIHHLACSGGTLISKCISAMPNVYLLSEVHPFTDLGIDKGKPKYAPTDLISLTKYAGIPKQKELAGRLFKQSIDNIYEHVTCLGGILVLRDHTHADFNTEQLVPAKSTLIELLEDTYEVKSILTIRNPIDSYASLLKNGWVHFEPQTLDEYCRRLLLLIEQFNSEQLFEYEEFLKAPRERMQEITNALELPFDDTFEDVFGVFKVTGDSGRSSDVISDRSRIAPEEIIRESQGSQNFRKLKKFNWLEDKCKKI